MATTTMRNPAPTAISQDVRVGQNRWAAIHRWAATRQIPQGPTVSVREPSPCPPCARGRRPPDPRTQTPWRKALVYARGRE